MVYEVSGWKRKWVRAEMTLEIHYHGGYAGNVYAGPKTKEEVKELIERFLDLPIEGLGLRFEWVQSTEADG